ILARWSEAERRGYALVLDEQGALALWLGNGEATRISSGAPLRAGAWYFVAASYDATANRARLVQRPFPRYTYDASDTSAERLVAPGAPRHPDAPLLIAAT